MGSVDGVGGMCNVEPTRWPAATRRPLRHRWSYSLYLAHYPIFVLFGHTGLAPATGTTLVIIVASGIRHEVIEKPLLILRDRLRTIPTVNIQTASSAAM